MEERFLRRKGTDRIFGWNPHIANRPDLEEISSELAKELIQKNRKPKLNGISNTTAPPIPVSPLPPSEQEEKIFDAEDTNWQRFIKVVRSLDPDKDFTHPIKGEEPRPYINVIREKMGIHMSTKTLRKRWNQYLKVKNSNLHSFSKKNQDPKQAKMAIDASNREINNSLMGLTEDG